MGQRLESEAGKSEDQKLGRAEGGKKGTTKRSEIRGLRSGNCRKAEEPKLGRAEGGKKGTT